MRHLEFARRSEQENQQRKVDRHKLYEKEKDRVKSTYVNYNETARKEIFNPETDHPEDAPELTKEGYSFAKNRFFVARNFFDKTHVEWTQHLSLIHI